MKLRYYLRGLGIGIIVTAIIMGTSGSASQSISDAEIRQRAIQLGMVDSSTTKLSDLQQNDVDVSGNADNLQENLNEEQEPTHVTEPAIETESTGENEQTAESVPETDTGTEPTGETEPTAETGPGDNATTGDRATIGDNATAGDNITVGENMESAPEAASATDGEGGGNTPAAGTQTADTAVITISRGAGSGSVSRDLQEAGLISDAKAYDQYLCDNGYSRSIRIGTYEIAIGTDEETIAKIITGKQ